MATLEGVHGNFYPRPPRGGRRLLICTADLGGHISIHALREEGDRNRYSGRDSHETFLSTPSARRATQLSHHLPSMTANFYPRPPRGGRPTGAYCRAKADDFYPRPPRGGRPADEAPEYNEDIFLSTPSARRATDEGRPPVMTTEISIHALREEGDPLVKAYHVLL